MASDLALMCLERVAITSLLTVASVPNSNMPFLEVGGLRGVMGKEGKSLSSLSDQYSCGSCQSKHLPPV